MNSHRPYAIDQRPSTNDSFAHDLDDDALGALAVEFGVEDALPGTQVEASAGDGQDDLPSCPDTRSSFSPAG
jgi:hypothetical protein